MTDPRGRSRAGDVALVDFGDGRRLERFGPYLVDRPAPAAADPRAEPRAWAAADARFVRTPDGRGTWEGPRGAADPWEVRLGGLRFELRLTDAGGIGLFPEQLATWRWVGGHIRSAGRPITLLNLFGHTGGTSLAAAAVGATVVHLDASRGAVAWARRNAESSGLADRPIRWIVDDAEAFVARELRRGHGYDAVVLDPPSYGHGPGGERWRLEDRLPGLLRSCASLTRGRRAFIVLTAHTHGLAPDDLAAALAGSVPPDELRRGRLDRGILDLTAEDGRSLPSGAFARWSAGGAGGGRRAAGGGERPSGELRGGRPSAHRDLRPPSADRDRRPPSADRDRRPPSAGRPRARP